MRAAKAPALVLGTILLAGCPERWQGSDDCHDAGAHLDGGSADQTSPPDDAPEPGADHGGTGDAGSDAGPPIGCEGYADPVVAGTLGSPLLTEVSGLVASRKNPGVFYVHNDSGDEPRFFAIDGTGQLLAELRLPGASPGDWEDIAVGPCQAGSCVFVGDIGDNAQARNDVAVYRIPEPAIALGELIAEPIDVAYERIPFTYPDGPKNAETLLVHPGTGAILIVIKVSDTTSGAVYRFPQPLEADVPVTLEKVADFNHPACGVLLTGGDVHPSGERVLLRGRLQVCELRLAPGAPFESLFASTPIALPVATTERQGEAITYAADGFGYYTTSEGAGAPLHRYDCGTSTQPPPADGGTSGDGGPCDCGLGAQTCQMRGYRAGTLRCSADCQTVDESGCSNVRINEVDSNPNPDWVELYNPGPGDADLSGYVLTDNAPDDPSHRYTFPAGTNIPAGGLLVVNGKVDLPYGLGAQDFVRLYEPGGTVIDEISWTEHAAGSLARCPDGGDLVVDTTPTKGVSNAASCSQAPTCQSLGFRAGTVRCADTSCSTLDTSGCSNVRINEVESNPNPDWIELYNPGPGAADLSGYTFTDADVDDPTHRYTFPAGTVVPAGGFVVLHGDTDFFFGLGGADTVRLHEPGGTLIDEVVWSAHAAGTLARCPDGGDTVVDVATPSQGASNAGACP